jgi:hypothetical protein
MCSDRLTSYHNVRDLDFALNCVVSPRSLQLLAYVNDGIGVAIYIETLTSSVSKSCGLSS